MLAALKAQPLVGVSVVSRVNGKRSRRGPFDLVIDWRRGRASLVGGAEARKTRAFMIGNRSLFKDAGTSCWRVENNKGKGLPADHENDVLRIGPWFISPSDVLIDGRRLADPAFSIIGPEEIRWRFTDGESPATETEVAERYDPATMLPAFQHITQRYPKTQTDPAGTVTLNFDFSYTGLTPAASSSPWSGRR